MKKILLIVAISLTFASCYQSRIIVGNVEDRPTTQVAYKKNHSIIYGLVPLDVKLNAKNYIENKKNYEIRTEHSFVDGLLYGLTVGLYSPTTTKILVPQGE